MTNEQALALVKANWKSQGQCRTCGWHALLSEYGNTDAELIAEMLIEENVVELPCLNPEAECHRGVRIIGDKK